MLVDIIFGDFHVPYHLCQTLQDTYISPMIK